jgi:hypothetical protein
VSVVLSTAIRAHSYAWGFARPRSGVPKDAKDFRRVEGPCTHDVYCLGIGRLEVRLVPVEYETIHHGGPGFRERARGSRAERSRSANAYGEGRTGECTKRNRAWFKRGFLGGNSTDDERALTVQGSQHRTGDGPLKDGESVCTRAFPTNGNVTARSMSSGSRSNSSSRRIFGAFSMC